MAGRLTQRQFPVKLAIMIPGAIVFCLSFCWGRSSSPVISESFDGTTVGARAIGMGESFVALADDGTAPYWNPAGLVSLKANLCTLMLDLGRGGERQVEKSEPLQGKKFVYLSFCSNTGALSWRVLSAYREENTETYSEREINIAKYTLSYAIPHSASVAVGVNINYLHGSLGIAQKSPSFVNIARGNGWGFDWGLIYTPSSLFAAGACLENAPAFIYWNDYSSDRLPLNLRVGLVIKIRNSLSFTSDFHQRLYARKIDKGKNFGTYHIGAECMIVKNFFLRLGIFGRDLSREEERNYTSGLGYKRKFYSLDFALKRYYPGLSSKPVYSYIVSLSFPF